MAALAPIAAPLMIAGGGLQAIGAIQQANTQVAQLNAQATTADYNAAALDQQANVARGQTSAEEVALRRKQRQFLATGRAAAAQGGDLSGSTARVLDTNAILAELDALNVRYKGDLVARDLESRATHERYQAGVARSLRSPTRRAGFLGAAAGLLTAGAQAGSFGTRLTAAG